MSCTFIIILNRPCLTFHRLAVPALAKRPTLGKRADDASPDQGALGQSGPGIDGRSQPGSRLSPLSSPRHALGHSLVPWERSKSFDESSDAQCGHRDLESWRSQREGRLRPWAADVSPKHSPRGSRSDLEQIGLEYGKANNRNKFLLICYCETPAKSFF